MELDNIFFVAAAVLCTLTCGQGMVVVWRGAIFLRDVKRAVAGSSAPSRYQPKAAIILPCCGVDEVLRNTVDRLARQNYAAYEVVFTFESAEDAAYAAIGEWTAGWKIAHRRVIAGLTQHRSQKIHNLLAAVEQVSPDTQVLVFLDSDAVPHADWLTQLVAPLANERVGAATGFRWYCAAGGLANGIRSVWNAASLTLMEHADTRFCWGGATAMRRERFASLDIAGRWDRALSDDLQVTQAIRNAGLDICFVPQALIPSHDRTTLRGFWEFARRQLIITRICAPQIWRAGFLLCMNFVVGGSVAAVIGIGSALGWFGSLWTTYFFLIAWGIIILTSTLRAWLRQLAVWKILKAPDLTWRDFFWDVSGAPTSGLLHLALFFASMGTRTIRWRHTIYELVSPSETRVVRRI